MPTICTDLQTALQAGEGYYIEFKRSVTSDLAREMVAFANSSGGTIFIGVEDDGAISGVANTNELKSRVQSIARDCDPPVAVHTEVLDNVLVIKVEEGRHKPHRCANGFYIRSGASCTKLSTQEIIDFIKSEGKFRFDELICPNANSVSNLDESAMKRYLALARITSVLRIDNLLGNLGVLEKDKAGSAFNNAGVLFFAKEPAKILPHCVVTCLLFKGNSKAHILDSKSFEFDLLRNIDETLLFIQRHLNLTYEIKNVRRKEIAEIPEFVLREAVVNAVAHRDYFERGASVQVEIYDNRIEISNPGSLPKGLNEANFGKHSLARNSLIAALLHRCNYIEKIGTGIQRMREGMRNAGLPEPAFGFDGFFTVVLQRFNLEKQIMDDFNLNNKRAMRLAAILRQLILNGFLNIEEAAKELNTSDRTIRNEVDLLIAKGWVDSRGNTKGKEYSITQEGLIKTANKL